MIEMHFKHDPSFPVFHHDQIDIYELYTILKRRCRLEIERLSADIETNKKIRDVANMIDMEQRIIDRRTRKPEDYELQ